MRKTTAARASRLINETRWNHVADNGLVQIGSFRSKDSRVDEDRSKNDPLMTRFQDRRNVRRECD